MKNIIRACVFGVVSVFALAACGDNGKDVSGAYHYKDWSGSDVTVSLSSEGGGKYNIKLESAKGDDKNVYDWGKAVVSGDYIIRGRDDEKVFEIVDENHIKRLDVVEQPVLKRVNVES